MYRNPGLDYTTVTVTDPNSLSTLAKEKYDQIKSGTSEELHKLYNTISETTEGVSGIPAAVSDDINNLDNIFDKGDRSLADIIQSIIDKIIEAISEPSPLVLDLDGDGVELVDQLSVDAVHFDLSINGYASRTGWIAGGDGFLAVDLNMDGLINSGAELFGDQTGFDNGFLALAAYDSNADGLISSEDQIWKDLRVWVDVDQDGWTDNGELFSLDEKLITSINLTYTEVSYAIAGNNVYQEGSFTINGNVNVIADVYFATDTVNTIYSGNYDIDSRVLFMPTLRGYGTLGDISVAMSMDNDDYNPASLLSLVTDFSELTTAEIFASDTVAMDAVRAVMYRWANVDAQELGFLEAMTGQPFLQQGYRPDPLWNAGADLTEAFELAHNHFFATLAAQTAAGEIFTGDFYYNISTDSFDGITGLNTDVLDDLETAAALLTTTQEKEDLWINVVRVIEYTVGVDNLDGTSLTALEDAIDAAGSDLTFLVDSLVETPAVNEIDGTSGVDTLEGTGGRDFIDAGSDNDTLSGLSGNDDLYGRNGSDTLAGDAGSDYLNGGDDGDTYVYNVGDGIDIIDDAGGTTGDKILFGAGFDADDITISRVGRYDMEIALDNGTAANDNGEYIASPMRCSGGV